MLCVVPRWFVVAWVVLVSSGILGILFAPDLKPVSWFSVYSWLAVVMARGSLLKFIMFFVFYYSAGMALTVWPLLKLPIEMKLLFLDIMVPAVASIADDVVIVFIRKRQQKSQSR